MASSSRSRPGSFGPNSNNDDINDPRFKLPFNHGWRREFVKRNPKNKSKIQFDVYYYSPTNKKFRSLKDLESYLKPKTTKLTLKNFTFLKQLIGMDESKELIRNALTKNTKLLGRRPRPEILEANAVIEPLNTTRSTQERQAEESQDEEMQTNGSQAEESQTEEMQADESEAEEMQGDGSQTEEMQAEWNQAEEILAEWNDAEEMQGDGSQTEEMQADESEAEEMQGDGSQTEEMQGDGSQTEEMQADESEAEEMQADGSQTEEIKVEKSQVEEGQTEEMQDLWSEDEEMQAERSLAEECHTEEMQAECSEAEEMQAEWSDDEESLAEEMQAEKNLAEECHTEEMQAECSETEEMQADGIRAEEMQADKIQAEEMQSEELQSGRRQAVEMQSEETQAEDSHSGHSLDSQSTFSLPIPDMESSTNVKQRASEMNELQTIMSGQDSKMQFLNDMNDSLKCVFAHLNIEDLITASKVCSSWSNIALDSCLWKNVYLKNMMVDNWKDLVELINVQGSISLETRGMVLPTSVQDLDTFWSNFSIAIPNATKLEVLELYKCPIRVFHNVINSLQQLKKLNVTLIKNPHDNAQIVNELISLNMNCMSNMTNLTELRISGETKIELLLSQELTFLTNLKTLSLTSIQSFPEEFFNILGTTLINLETLEIGDCENLPDDFTMFLKKITNLRSLRLENCYTRFLSKNLGAIRSMKNLKKLELINAEITDFVAIELRKCHGITALLIIPLFEEKYLRISDIFIQNYQKSLSDLGYSSNLSEKLEPLDNMAVYRTTKIKLQSELSKVNQSKLSNPLGTESPENDYGYKLSLDTVSVSELKHCLKSIFGNTKVKIIKILTTEASQVFLSKHFDDF
ncbi:Methyl-CpG DNA binding,F-box domain,Leucine-rich repeat domain, L domain-like,DNA-binding domain [Cinara cedri]|uniref:Methyl-CpG DNA binding,F-box domain,Leucine-rich repeat domain, L domain-like,DNA-binding domain n=1 Tax=Cinara cedri TaxID=506608 RepID=A0A5E4N2T3_9HEMI|nr:Methyl-CpG DNA binding,F-box domain,Leucine-rich repeat domain, L domain-like,DNA-binding domain [Cinara cedri]